jgi:hypothetical protein
LNVKKGADNTPEGISKSPQGGAFVGERMAGSNAFRLKLDEGFYMHDSPSLPIYLFNPSTSCIS